MTMIIIMVFSRESMLHNLISDDKVSSKCLSRTTTGVNLLNYIHYVMRWVFIICFVNLCNCIWLIVELRARYLQQLNMFNTEILIFAEYTHIVLICLVQFQIIAMSANKTTNYSLFRSFFIHLEYYSLFLLTQTLCTCCRQHGVAILNLVQ